jgi:hypothetical protein
VLRWCRQPHPSPRTRWPSRKWRPVENSRDYPTWLQQSPRLVELRQPPAGDHADAFPRCRLSATRGSTGWRRRAHPARLSACGVACLFCAYVGAFGTSAWATTPAVTAVGIGRTDAKTECCGCGRSCGEVHSRLRQPAEQSFQNQAHLAEQRVRGALQCPDHGGPDVAMAAMAAAKSEVYQRNVAAAGVDGCLPIDVAHAHA